MSFYPLNSLLHCLSTARASVFPSRSVGVSSLPRCYQSIASSVQNYLQWLISDELVSIGRSLEPVSPALLQSVATHVQTTPTSIQSCVAQQVPLKFVFGEASSVSYFSQQLETLEVPGYRLHHQEDEYYYLTPKPPEPGMAHLGDLTPDLLSSNSETRLSSGQLTYSQEPASVGMERSRTPPPPQAVPPALRVHRRSMSSGHPPQQLLSAHLLPQFRVSALQTATSAASGSQDLDVQLATVEVSSTSGYEAGLSDDASSCVSDRLLIKRSPAAPQLGEGVKEKVWLVVRVLTGQVEVYFQLRSCEQWRVEEEVWSKIRGVCDALVEAVRHSCHRTNQWLLLKDMLDTHSCSPYLLSQSAPEAWVEEVVLQQGRHDTFRAQEFMCDQVFNFHITPHWRIKDMKGVCVCVCVCVKKKKSR